MSKDYYGILGVSKTASQDEIKRAYRKLAHQHHPDKAGVESDTKFKEINEAYQVLSDPQKRGTYDQFGTAEPGGGGSGGFNWGSGEETQGQNWDFNGFGGGLGDIFESVFSQAFSQVQTEIQISLTDALLGRKIELQTSNRDRIVLDIPSGTQDGTTFRFPGKGQAHRRGRGDLLITVRVALPHRLSREQKELLEKLRNSGL